MLNHEFSFVPVGFPETPNFRISLSLKGVEGKLADRINTATFNRDIPSISLAETVSLVMEKTIEPLKETPAGKFGSKWNQLTAVRAIRSMGIPESETTKHLVSDRETGVNLRKTQAFIAKQIELDLATKVELLSTELKPQAARIMFVRQRVAIFLSALNKLPDIPKKEKQDLSLQATATMIDFINKFGQQTFDRAELARKIIVALTTDNPIQIINIQCPPFRHTSQGIEVIPTAEDQIITNGEGISIRLSQHDVWNEIRETVAIFENNRIPAEVLTAIVNIDEFVMKDQVKKVVDFSRSFIGVTKCPTVRFVSDITGIDDLESTNTVNIWKIWQENVAKTTPWAMKLLDEEFARLQRTSLPSHMKTRQFATHMAGRRFVVHFLIGSSFSQQFPQGIIMLRARGNEASDIDRKGAKSVGKTIFVVNHWRERKEVK